MSASRVLWVALAAAGLAGCHLPQPFRGDPGRMGAILSAPPPARLAVAVSPSALLDDRAAALWAHETTDALLGQSIPAEAQAPHPGDWRLRLDARLSGGSVVPSYVVLTPTGAVKGHRDGAPVPAAAWSAGDAQVLHRVAEAAAPQIVTTLTGLRSAEMRADPDSLMNRPARIFLAGVQGAPGDGNRALADELRLLLPDAKDQLVGSAAKADYQVSCTVTVAPPTVSPQGRVQKTEIVWRVKPARGVEAGAVTQLHDVPAGSLDHGWGDIALAVVTEAAPGIRTVIDNHSGRLLPPPPPDVAAAAGPVGPPGATDTPVLAPDEEAPGVKKLNAGLAEPVAPFAAATRPARKPDEPGS